MKIFLSFLQSKIMHPIPAYDFWQYYIKNGIEEAGYEWSEHPDVDWARGLVPQSREELAIWKEETWNKTVGWLKKNPVDLFLSYLYPEQIDISAIKEIQKLGIPCINFYCDNIRQFRTIPPEFGVFDLNWVPEHKAVRMYKKAGYPFTNLPMPMWITPQLRLGRKEVNRQVTFIGSKDIQRTMFFEDVVKKAPDIDLHIYGNGWSDNTVQQSSLDGRNSISKKLANQFSFIAQQGTMSYIRKIKQRNTDAAISKALNSKLKGIISFDEYNELTAGSMITAGINRYPSYRFPLTKPDTYPRLRDIEAPMLGACYLTEYAEGLEQLYDIDKEIAVYRNADDFIEKVGDLSANASLRKTLREGGQKRALTEHSIPRSLNKISERLK